MTSLDLSEGPHVFVARAPGRVNLIGEHTDYCQGVAFPMAIDLHTEVRFAENDSKRLIFFTDIDSDPADLPLDISLDRDLLRDIPRSWVRLAAAVAALSRPSKGGTAKIKSTIPIGSGLSSSASLCVALSSAFGVIGTPMVFAHLTQRAEAAIGSDVGLMDPIVIMNARKDHGLLIDFKDLSTTDVLLPAGIDIVVVHSGIRRQLASTPYAARRAECDAAGIEIGRPLGLAEPGELPGISDPIMRRRARHVVTECGRVRSFVEALQDEDLEGAGALMIESHKSMSQDLAISTPSIDQLVADLTSRPGVYGARLTGGGFGGCVVALTAAGALDVSEWPEQAWRVKTSERASVETDPTESDVDLGLSASAPAGSAGSTQQHPSITEAPIRIVTPADTGEPVLAAESDSVLSGASASGSLESEVTVPLEESGPSMVDASDASLRSSEAPPPPPPPPPPPMSAPLPPSEPPPIPIPPVPQVMHSNEPGHVPPPPPPVAPGIAAAAAAAFEETASEQQQEVAATPTPGYVPMPVPDITSETPGERAYQPIPLESTYGQPPQPLMPQEPMAPPPPAMSTIPFSAPDDMSLTYPPPPPPVATPASEPWADEVPQPAPPPPPPPPIQQPPPSLMPDGFPPPPPPMAPPPPPQSDVLPTPFQAPPPPPQQAVPQQAAPEQEAYPEAPPPEPPPPPPPPPSPYETPYGSQEPPQVLMPAGGYEEPAAAPLLPPHLANLMQSSVPATPSVPAENGDGQPAWSPSQAPSQTPEGADEGY